MTVAGGRALSMSGGGASASRPATYAARLRSPRSERKARTSAGPAKNQNHNTRYLRPLALGLVFALGVVLGVDLGMAFAFFGWALVGQGFCGGRLRGRLFFGEHFVRRVFQERLWHDGADRATRRDFGQHFGEQGLLARIHFGRRRLLVPVVVIVVTCPATDFGGLARQQGYNRVVHDALALDAIVVDDVA